MALPGRSRASELGNPPMTVGLLSPCPVSASDIFVVQAGDIQMRVIIAIGRESEVARETPPRSVQSGQWPRLALPLPGSWTDSRSLPSRVRWRTEQPRGGD